MAYPLILRLEFAGDQDLVDYYLIYIVLSDVLSCAVYLECILVVFNDRSSSKQKYFDY